MSDLHLGALRVFSPDFEPEARLPERHTSDGADVAPTLQFEAVPSATRSLAVVCHDPDAPKTYGFDHWVIYNVPPERIDVGPDAASDVTEGRNSFGTLGYRGPAPPPGHGLHHYYFHLYALDTQPDAPSGLTRRELLELIDAHIIEQARIVGTYSKGQTPG
jgi:Raf kinase inhibitor-like YbhB/YbcL family protein